MKHIRRLTSLIVLPFLIIILTGCGGGIKQGSPKPTVKIGAILPLTGPTAYLGEDERLGMQLALEERSPESIPIQMIYEDSQGKADLALTAARKLLDFQDIRIHIVSATTPVMATLPAYKQSGKEVLVIAQCMVPEITKGYPFAYRLYATSDEETDLLAAYAGEKGYKRVAALHIRNQFGEQGVKYFDQKLRKLGGEVLQTESFSFSDTDFRITLQKFKTIKPDAILIYAYSTNFPGIFQQMQESGLKIPVLGNADLALGGLEKKVAPDFLRGVVFPAPRYYSASSDPKVKAFNEKVRTRGKEPNFDMALSYDMTNILARAIDTCASSKPNEIGAAILKLSPYDGVACTFHLNNERDTRAEMHLMRWGTGGLEEAWAKK